MKCLGYFQNGFGWKIGVVVSTLFGWAGIGVLWCLWILWFPIGWCIADEACVIVTVVAMACVGRLFQVLAMYFMVFG